MKWVCVGAYTPTHTHFTHTLKQRSEQLRISDIGIVMSMMTVEKTTIDHLRQALGERPGIRLEANTSLARYSAARLGGPADLLLEVNSAEDLAQAANLLWRLNQPFMILGGEINSKRKHQ